MIAVVHLVWGPLGGDPLRNFIASYREHTADVEHELIVLFNGVGEAQREDLKTELASVEHRILELPEPVQDLTAYAWAAERLDHDRLCFLNSHSAILASGWLAMLDHALGRPGAGLVGATGSWTSLRSLALRLYCLPSAYRGVMPTRRSLRDELGSIANERDGGSGGGRVDVEQPRHSPLRATLAAVRSLPTAAEHVARFQGFPNPHLRTNGFMLPRNILTGLDVGRLRRKADAYALESGRASLMHRVQSLGLRALVVDRAGDTYEHGDWPDSHTLWQGGQERLLIADNQTRMYEHGSFDRRRLLSAIAWGSRADPLPPFSSRG